MSLDGWMKLFQTAVETEQQVGNPAAGRSESITETLPLCRGSPRSESSGGGGIRTEELRRSTPLRGGERI